MFGLLARSPRFARLWLAGAISLVGDWLSLVAVSILAADRGGGPLALAGVLAAHALPGAVMSPVAGVLVDRFDRRRLLLGAALAQAALTLVMALGAMRGAIGLVQLALLARSAVASLVPPAETAALRHVVEEADLLVANTLVASTWSIAYVVGMALGGVLAMLGPTLAIALDAVSFVACAGLIATLPRMPPPPRTSAARPGIRMFVADLGEALTETRTRPALRRAALAKVPVALAAGGAWLALNLVAAVAQPLGRAALSLGILQAVRGAGTGIGPILATSLARRGISASSLAAAAYALAFLGMALFARGGAAPALLGAALAWGMGSGANWVLSHTELQRQAGPGLVGRLASFDELAVTVAMVAGTTVTAVLVDRGHALMPVTLGVIGVGVLAWWTLIATTRGATRTVARDADPQAGS